MRTFAAALAFALLPASACWPDGRPNAAVASLIDSARMWEAKNRGDLARFALEKALLVDPANPRVLLELGIIEIKSNQLQRAAELLETARAAHPNDKSTEALGDAYRIATTDRMPMATVRFLANSSLDKKDEAVSALRALFPRGPPGGELGIEYYHILSTTDRGRPEAKAGLERLIRESPSDPRPRLELADFFIDKPETRMKGIQMAAELARRDDIRQEAVFKIWRRGLKKLDIDPTFERLLASYLELNPDDTEIQQRLSEVSAPLLKARFSAIARLRAGQTALAEKQFTEILKEYPNDLESLEAMGRIRLGQGRIDEAQGYFNRVARVDPRKAGRWDSQIRTARYWGLLKAAKTAQQEARFGESERQALAAVRLKPNETEGLLTLANLYLDRQDWSQAERYSQSALRVEPGSERALKALITIYSRSGDRQAALEAIDRFAKAYPTRAGTVEHERASLIREHADELLQQGQTRAAMSMLEKGIEVTPKDPWLRYDLARLYARMGFSQAGRDVMQEIAPPDKDAQGYYAKALFLAGIDDEEGALATLQAIPASLRTESIESLMHQQEFRLMKRRVREARQDGRATAARRMIVNAEAQAGQNPDRLWEVAGLWVELGEVKPAISLWQRVMLGQAPEVPTETQLRYADLLNDAKRDEELQDRLTEIAQADDLTEAQTRWLRSLQCSYALRRADTLIARGSTAEAVALLESTLKAQPQEPRLLRALGAHYADAADPAKARQYYDRILAADPLDFDARLSKVKLARLAGDEQQAYRDLDALRNSVPPDDVETHLGIARQLSALGKTGEAHLEIDQVRKTAPADPQILTEAAKIEEGASHYERALALLREALIAEARAKPSSGQLPPTTLRYLSPTAREIQEIEGRRYGYVSAGFDYRELSGTKGISGVTNQEYPMLFRYPVGYDGHVFAQVDYSTVSAGKLQLGDFERAQEFGKIDALGSPGVPGSLDQSAAGGAFGVGYQTDDWRFDVGSSPQGYAVSYPVGGIRHSSSWGDVYYSWDVGQRPVANSKLSYAGAHDPITGEVWGGVRAAGGEIYAGYDYGRLGLFAQGSAHYYSGKNVRTNNDVMFRGGADWNFIQEPDMRLNAGFALMYWSYAENQRFYTFGYGGYFSPQDYKSVSLPIQWTGRFGDLSYLLRAYGAYSYSSEEGGVYYPTDRDLQAIAAERAGTEANGFVFPKPFHDASSGPALSYGVRGAVEYQVASNWFLGGLLELQRSPFYTPNYMTFYFRYAFEPRSETLPYPPAALRPYYRY